MQPNRKELMTLLELSRARGVLLHVGDDVATVYHQQCEVGEIRFKSTPEGIQVKRSDINPAGKGIGTEAYTQLFCTMLLRGKQVESDAKVSYAAVRVYEKLREQGFDVQVSDRKRAGPYGVTSLSREELRAQSEAAGSFYDKESGIRRPLPFNPEGPGVYSICRYVPLCSKEQVEGASNHNAPTRMRNQQPSVACGPEDQIGP